MLLSSGQYDAGASIPMGVLGLLVFVLGIFLMIFLGWLDVKSREKAKRDALKWRKEHGYHD